PGLVGDDVGHRRRHPGAVGRVVPAGAGARATGAAGRAGDVSVQRGGASAADAARATQRLRAVARPDGGADDRELPLSDRASALDPRHGGAGDHGRSPVMAQTRRTILADRWFTTRVGITAAVAISARLARFAVL